MRTRGGISLQDWNRSKMTTYLDNYESIGRGLINNGQQKSRSSVIITEIDIKLTMKLMTTESTCASNSALSSIVW